MYLRVDLQHHERKHPPPHLGIVRNLDKFDNFLIILIQKLFNIMKTYTQIDNLNVTHSKHAYLNEL
jgi:hypothetical protein